MNKKSKIIRTEYQICVHNKFTYFFILTHISHIIHNTRMYIPTPTSKIVIEHYQYIVYICIIYFFSGKYRNVLVWPLHVWIFFRIKNSILEGFVLF